MLQQQATQLLGVLLGQPVADQVEGSGAEPVSDGQHVGDGKLERLDHVAVVAGRSVRLPVKLDLPCGPGPDVDIKTNLRRAAPQGYFRTTR